MIINKINDYNGWTNYETWRINLEILGDIQWDEYEEFEMIDEDTLKEYVENAVFDNYSGNMGLMEDYARAFLANVNYREILDSILENENLTGSDIHK
jgi:hypothetical protein